MMLPCIHCITTLVLKSNDTGVRGFGGTGVRGFGGTGVRGFAGTGVRGFAGTCVLNPHYIFI